METEPTTQPTQPSILERLEAGDSFSTLEVLAYKREPRLVEVLTTPGQRSAMFRRALLDLLIELGRPTLPPEGGLPERPALYIGDGRVVAWLVSATADEVPEIRDRACRKLAEEVPDLVIRDHVPEIIANLRRHFNADGAALVLGKTGAAAAKELLLSEPQLAAVEPEATRAALARLGDRAAEEEMLRSYARAAKPSDKAKAAWRLGYVGSVRCVLALARDMRTPETYVWQAMSRRSMRVHIIAGLRQAFPAEPVFWPPFFRPEDDAYYEQIEKWLEEKLGVNWTQPRPPFLYQEDAPVPMPR